MDIEHFKTDNLEELIVALEPFVHTIGKNPLNGGEFMVASSAIQVLMLNHSREIFTWLEELSARRETKVPPVDNGISPHSTNGQFIPSHKARAGIKALSGDRTPDKPHSL